MAAARPDLVHLHGEFVLDHLKVPMLFHCPRIVSPHGAFHAQVVGKNPLLKRAYLGLARRALHRHAAFHALSPAERVHILQANPHAEVFVFPNGPSPQMEEHISLQTRSRMTPRAGSGPLCFLFAGRLDVSPKGLDILLDAFALASHRLQQRETVLVLAGPDDGDGKSALQRQASGRGIEKRVRFLGRLGAPELARVYEEADIYVQLSRNDAFSLSVVDALSLGIPTILSREVGIASYEEVSSLAHVAVVPLTVEIIAQRMISFARDLRGLREKARESRAAIQDYFSWVRVASSSLEVYRDVLATWNA